MRETIYRKANEKENYIIYYFSYVKFSLFETHDLLVVRHTVTGVVVVVNYIVAHSLRMRHGHKGVSICVFNLFLSTAS